jgi:hypothetical protein
MINVNVEKLRKFSLKPRKLKVIWSVDDSFSNLVISMSRSVAENVQPPLLYDADYTDNYKGKRTLVDKICF